MANILVLRPYLPIVASAVGAGGVYIGIYSFISPMSAARIYGIGLPHLDTIAAKERSHSDPKDAEEYSQLASYIYSYGARNLVAGLTIESLLWYWRWSDTCRLSKLKREAAQQCLGIALVVGSITPTLDAVITWNTPSQGSAKDAGKKATKVHTARALVWLGAGLWCLYGPREWLPTI